jgi:hypothetical protein
MNNVCKRLYFIHLHKEWGWKNIKEAFEVNKKLCTPQPFGEFVKFVEKYKKF